MYVYIYMCIYIYMLSATQARGQGGVSRPATAAAMAQPNQGSKALIL